jgi:hypothetical protein
MSLHGLVIDPGGPPLTDSARSPFADHERLAPVSERVRVWASVALITASTSAGTWTAVAPQPPAWGWLAWLGVPSGALMLILWGNDRESRLRRLGARTR